MSDKTIILPIKPANKLRDANSKLREADSMLYGANADDIKQVQLKIREAITMLDQARNIIYEWSQTMFSIANAID